MTADAADSMFIHGNETLLKTVHTYLTSGEDS